MSPLMNSEWAQKTSTLNLQAKNSKEYSIIWIKIRMEGLTT